MPVISAGAELPEGFSYQPNFLTESEETELLHTFSSLPFAPFDFHGYVAKRRIVEYGWEYDFTTREASTAPAIPEFLFSVRQRAAGFADVSPEQLVEAVVTEYPAGAPIGWHRDVPKFDKVIGISLGSSCRMRFKPYKAAGQITSIVLEPRSIYVLQGSARWRYQHSIPAVKALRYSVTFRTLRTKALDHGRR
jgi:alkylated DNA repair dioxygenase AlkB